jgi:hypothetical protein
VIKPRTMRCVGNVERLGHVRSEYEI